MSMWCLLCPSLRAQRGESCRDPQLPIAFHAFDANCLRQITTTTAAVVMNSGGFDSVDATKMLQDYVKAKLLPYKYPREIKFLDELPKTGTGKIDRQALLKA